MSKILLDRGINFSFDDIYNKIDLAKEYLNAKHLILCTDVSEPYSYDPSPRVIPESIYAGNSFLIRDSVLIHQDHYQFGYTYKKGDKNSFNENLEKMLNNFSTKNSQQMHDFSKKYLNMNFACESAYNQIIKAYEIHLNS